MTDETFRSSPAAAAGIASNTASNAASNTGSNAASSADSNTVSTGVANGAGAGVASDAANDATPGARNGVTNDAAIFPVSATEEASEVVGVVEAVEVAKAAGDVKAAGDASQLRSGRHTSWDALPLETPAQGLERRMLAGERLMVCRLHFAPHTVTPIHRHPHEQMTLIEQGRFRFTIAGKERIAAPGDVLHFPPDIEHGATCLDEPGVLVDIFTPIREDFLPRG